MGLEDITSNVDVDFGRFESDVQAVASRLETLMDITEGMSGSFSTLEDSATRSFSSLTGLSTRAIESLDTLQRTSDGLTASWRVMVAEGLTPLREGLNRFQTDILNLQGGLGASPTLGQFFGARVAAAGLAARRLFGLGDEDTGNLRTSPEFTAAAARQRGIAISQAIISRDRQADELFQDRERRDRVFLDQQALDRQAFVARQQRQGQFDGILLTDADRRSIALREFDAAQSTTRARRDLAVESKFNRNLEALDETMSQLVSQLQEASDEDILRVQILGDVR